MRDGWNTTPMALVFVSRLYQNRFAYQVIFIYLHRFNVVLK